MMFSGRQISLFLVIVSGLVTACGGGGGDSANSAVATGDANTFLVYPNPHVQDDGSYQTLSLEYAQAYYRAIDSSNSRDSLSKWKSANHFGDATSGEEVTVVFRDVRDLGYGRRMVVRRNNDGTIAAMVDNYQVTGVPGGAYTKLNVDAAVAEDQRWHAGTNAIEYSSITGDATAPLFVKFFTFGPSGERRLTANMDGLGEKPLPAVCGTCHGGRGDPLSPLTGIPSLRKFPSIANGVSGKSGDIGARLQPLQVGTFEYSDLRTTRGWMRSDQESAFKTINQIVLQTYPIPVASGAPEDALRPLAGANEWQGTAAQFIKDAYGAQGGNNMPDAQYSEPAVPTGWTGQETLYTTVVAPYCRTCHIVRGIKSQNDPDFMTYAKFTDYVKRIRFHVYDRGNMPLSKVNYDAFWSSDAPEVLATFLEGQGETGLRDGSGALLRPGRPVAIAGPNRASPSPALLSAANSLNATSYSWSILSAPAAATLSSPNSLSTMLTAVPDHDYQVQLVVGNGSGQSQPVVVTVHVVADLMRADGVTPLGKAPDQLRFSDIKAIIQTSAQTDPIDLSASPPTQCLHCHWRYLQPKNVLTARALPLGQVPFLPPSFFDDYDRDGSGGPADATDDYWLYSLVRGKLNMVNIEQSLLLRKPSNNPPNDGVNITTNVGPFDNHHHAFAHPVNGFNLNSWSTRNSYDVVLNWILYGAPY